MKSRIFNLILGSLWNEWEIIDINNESEQLEKNQQENENTINSNHRKAQKETLEQNESKYRIDSVWIYEKASEDGNPNDMLTNI